MKSVSKALLSCVLIGLLFTGCSKEPDHTMFKTARIDQGGSAPWVVNVKSWTDYGSQIQIETDDGSIILADKSRVIFTNK